MDKYNIKLSKVVSISDIIEQFSFFKKLKKDSEIALNIEIPDRVYPEYLTIVVSVIKYYRSFGIKININVHNPSNNTYVSRINFYKELEIEHDENFTRHNSTGKLVEITNFNGTNNVAITNNILKIIRDKCNVDSTVVSCLNYCFFEMVDNIENHAKSTIGGYTVAQNYKHRNELRIVIIDKGIGIYESLTKTLGTKYNKLSPENSLLHCIKKEVTNGKGMGNGLFHAKEFIVKNGGDMEIYSGSHCLKISDGKIKVVQTPHWQGTLIYVRINTNTTLNFESIFGNDVPETVVNSNDSIDNDYIDNSLW